MQISVPRLIIGGVVAGLVVFLLDGVLHGVVLQSRWAAAMSGIGRPVASGDAGSFKWFITSGIFTGLAAVAIYVGLRGSMGAGPRTAIVAGLLAWLLAIPVPLLSLVPMHVFGRSMLVIWAVLGAIPIVVGTLAGGAIYRDAATSAAGAPRP